MKIIAARDREVNGATLVGRPARPALRSLSTLCSGSNGTGLETGDPRSSRKRPRLCLPSHRAVWYPPFRAIADPLATAGSSTG